MFREAPETKAGEAGMTLIEVMVAATLGLVVALGAFGFIDSSRRSYASQNALTTAQSDGRTTADVFTRDARGAGYSPLGVPFDAVPSGAATSVRLRADLNGNGVVGGAGETDEDLTYTFLGPTNGIYQLQRGVDLNGDGDFTDINESVDIIATNIVPIDTNGDGATEAFLAYDYAPPWATTVTLTFGVRTAKRDVLKRQYPVTSFRSKVALRNRR